MFDRARTDRASSQQLLTCALQNFTGNLTKVRKKLTGYDIRYDVRYGVRYGFQGPFHVRHSNAAHGTWAGSDTTSRPFPLGNGMTGWYGAGDVHDRVESENAGLCAGK